ncbi:ATP-binding protein [Caldicellulosiruptoraceae bacterium PP1]
MVIEDKNESNESIINHNEIIIGKTSVTKESANTESEFSFWIKDGVLINPFDFVTVEQEFNTKTFGIVGSISAVTDAESHLTNYVSNDFGNVDTSPNTVRISSNIARCLVMQNTGVDHPKYQNKNIKINVLMPIPNEKKVTFSTASEVEKALGSDNIKEEKKIPAGVILQSNGDFIPLFFDKDYILGPEGAHINISGISGLATKTSYAMFIIQSILQKSEPKPCVIIFNVKKDDLLSLHEEPTDFDELDEVLYEKLNLQKETFTNIKYFLPRGGNGQPNSYRIPHSNNVKQYAFTLKNVLNNDNLSFLFSEVNDPEYTIESIVYGLSEKQNDINFLRTNWEILSKSKIFNNCNKEMSLSVFLGNEINIRSIGKFIRHLKRTMNKNVGLFVNNLSNQSSETDISEEINQLTYGDVAVIDIANINDDTKGFIIGCVMKAIDRRIIESDDDTPPFLIFVDELNKYAPKSIKVSSVTEQLIEISARGRSSSIALIGAEQFKSQINIEVNENCSTHILGRTGSMELSSDAYKAIPTTMKNNLTNLEKGELIVLHPLFKQPVKVRFPKPYYKRP